MRCCRSQSAAQGFTPVPEDQVSTYRHCSPVRLLPLAVHILPIALVQFMDFVSDSFVIYKLYKNESSTSAGAWIVGIVAISLSVFVSWVFIAFDEFLTCREKFVPIVLAPFNLHILVIGILYMNMNADDNRRKELYNSFHILKITTLIHCIK